MTANTPASRIRAYLKAHPDTANLGEGMFTRGDLEQVLADRTESLLAEAPALRHCLYPTCRREYDVAAWIDGKQPARPSRSGEGWHSVWPNVATGYVCPDHTPVIMQHRH